MKLTEFTPVHPVRVPGDPGLHSHVTATKLGATLETGPEGVAIRKGSAVVIVPWSNVVQAVPAAEAAKAK